MVGFPTWTRATFPGQGPAQAQNTPNRCPDQCAKQPQAIGPGEGLRQTLQHDFRKRYGDVARGELSFLKM
eukprot:1159514-Pelagomonas_calceolata.AAC.3